MEGLEGASHQISAENTVYDSIDHDLESLELYLSSRAEGADGDGAKLEDAALRIDDTLKSVKKAETRIFHATNRYEKLLDQLMPKLETNGRIVPLSEPEAAIVDDNIDCILDRAIFWLFLRTGHPSFKEALKSGLFKRLLEEESANGATKAYSVFSSLYEALHASDNAAQSALEWLQNLPTLFQVPFDSPVLESFNSNTELYTLLLRSACHGFGGLSNSEKVLKLKSLADPFRGVVSEIAVSNLATKMVLGELISADQAQDDLERARLLLRDAACKALDLAPDSSIMIAVWAGKAAIPQLIRAQKLAAAAGPTRWSGSAGDQLLVEVDLPSELRFHAIFVCPVMKDDSHETGPPVLLPCRHILSRSAVVNLVALPNGARRCPYCPSTFQLLKAKEVEFV